MPGGNVDVTRGQEYFQQLRADTTPEHFTPAERDKRSFDVFKKTLVAPSDANACDEEDVETRLYHNFQLKIDRTYIKCCRKGWAYAHGLGQNKMNTFSKYIKEKRDDVNVPRKLATSSGFVDETFESMRKLLWNNVLDESQNVSFCAG